MEGAVGSRFFCSVIGLVCLGAATASGQGSSPQEPKVYASATFTTSPDIVAITIKAQKKDFDLIKMILYGDDATATPTEQSPPDTSTKIIDYNFVPGTPFPWEESAVDRADPAKDYWLAVELIAVDAAGDEVSFIYVKESAEPHQNYADKQMAPLRGLELSQFASFGIPRDNGDQIALIELAPDTRQYPKDWTKIELYAGTGIVPTDYGSLSGAVLTMTSATDPNYVAVKFKRGKPAWLIAIVSFSSGKLAYRQIYRKRDNYADRLPMRDLMRGKRF